MDDQEIIRLFWVRDQDAISMTQSRYGRYCYVIAMRIVNNHEDASECVNDTWLRAWQAIPPQKPRNLAIWLGRITRNLSLNRLSSEKAQKRGGGQAELAYEELENCLASAGSSASRKGTVRTLRSMAIIDSNPTPSESLEAKELAGEISSYLKMIPEKRRLAFIGRYYYFTDLDELSRIIGISKQRISVLLHRTRKDLISFLRDRGYSI